MLDIIAKRYKGYSIALTGCRAEGIDYECCEYDLIILDADEELININDVYFEIHRLSNNKFQRILQLYNSKIIQDPSLRLVALNDSVKPNMLETHAKNLLIDGLLDASDAKNNPNLLEASLMLKRAAYRYLNAILELNMIRPAPLHIFAQLKELDMDITLPLECLGVNQANSSSISRSLSTLNELLNSRLIKKKISYLYNKHKYVDCYLYIVHLGMMIAKDYRMFNKLRVILNLDAEQSTRKLGEALLDECKTFLRNIKS